MHVNINTSFIVLLVAGVSIAWRPIAHDRRCEVYSTTPALTKCGSYRYQYDRKNNLCQSTCSAVAPFQSFMECSGNCRSVEVCFMHRPLSSCGSEVFPVYYFNPAKDACLVEYGCTYKGNNFPTLAECQRTCRAKVQGPPPVMPSVPGNTVPSQQNPTQSSTGASPPFTQQTPQSTWNNPTPPHPSAQPWNSGMPSPNQQQGAPGQSGPAMVPPPWNNQAPSSSHQRPQQPWNGAVSPTLQSPGSVPPFPPQSGQQPWNGPTMSQPGTQQQWGNGIPPLNPQQQPGTSTVPPYQQQPGHQSWSGQMVSPNQQHSPQQQWNNGAPPTSNPSIAPQQSGAVTMPTSPQQQWNPPRSSGIPTQGTQQQWGSGNLPASTLQPPSATAVTSSAQTGPQKPWGNIGWPVNQQPNTAAQPVNGAAQAPSNQLTQPSWMNPNTNAQTQKLVRRRVLSIKQQTTQQQWRRRAMTTISGPVN